MNLWHGIGITQANRPVAFDSIALCMISGSGVGTFVRLSFFFQRLQHSNG